MFSIFQLFVNPLYRFSVLRRLGVYHHLSDEQYVKKAFKARKGISLNLDHPRTFCEKIQWLKVFYHNPEYTKMVDKYGAKEYVKAKLGSEYIVPLLGVWDSFDYIDFDSLPDQFVLKVTHDSGGLVVCRDKSKLDMVDARKRITKSLKKEYYLYGREWPYKDVKKRIIAEQYLENGAEGLHDYKIWCFNGRVEYIQYITGRIGDTFEAFYNRDWVKQGFCYHNPLMKEDVKKPEKLAKLIACAEILAEGTAFSRIDFYILETGEIKFGEITFYPMSGMDEWTPREMDMILGDMITLPQKMV